MGLCVWLADGRGECMGKGVTMAKVTGELCQYCERYGEGWYCTCQRAPYHGKLREPCTDASGRICYAPVIGDTE